ncbi:MAG: hypothetical protein GXY48_07640 [Methanomicrobiales archaeon]|nr:hypothetical protein [Methanomicrobiales archaeon]
MIKKRLSLTFIGLLIGIFCSSLVSAETTSAERTITDALGRELTMFLQYNPETCIQFPLHRSHGLTGYRELTRSPACTGCCTPCILKNTQPNN